jgi:hypothetical protein
VRLDPWALIAAFPGIFAPYESMLLGGHAHAPENMDEIEKLAQRVCAIYGVDAFWVLAIILQESGANRYQIRYEPNYKYLFHPETFANILKISTATEVESQKISWGLGQIMGALAREQGHQGLMAELIDPETNIHHMCRFIRTIKKDAPDTDAVFAMYNGGKGALIRKTSKYPNQKYVDSVNRRLKQLKKGNPHEL